jgi:hypothetical protein
MHIYNEEKEGCNDSMIKKANEYLDMEYMATNQMDETNDELQRKFKESKQEMNEALSQALSCLEPMHEDYVAGEAVIHSGAVIHSVAPWKFTGSHYKDARVTVQGFAFLCDGAWYLHW